MESALFAGFSILLHTQVVVIIIIIIIVIIWTFSSCALLKQLNSDNCPCIPLQIFIISIVITIMLIATIINSVFSDSLSSSGHWHRQHFRHHTNFQHHGYGSCVAISGMTIYNMLMLTTKIILWLENALAKSLKVITQTFNTVGMAVALQYWWCTRLNVNFGDKTDWVSILMTNHIVSRINDITSRAYQKIWSDYETCRY